MPQPAGSVEDPGDLPGLQREPVRKPQNRESRSHSQPFSRARKMNQTHFTVNPRKRNGTGPHRSDFSYSLASWAALSESTVPVVPQHH
jgi:hypothetical protein